MRIALTGNPNSGKTTMFNHLTGRTERVGNWAGVTVDKKEASVKSKYTKGMPLVAVDLPGAYSISPFTCEESVTRDYVVGAAPDVIVNIVDATNLSRSLFFTTQLLELGIPMVVALNKQDMNIKKETRIDVALLSQKLGCPVIETAASTGAGLKELMSAAVDQAGKRVGSVLDGQDGDEARFAYVAELVAQVERRKVLTRQKNKQDQADDVLTHPVWGLFIFAAVMFTVFHISQAEGFLGLGKLLEGIFTGWLEVFQGYIAELVADASPILQALLVDGVIGGAVAVVGFLPLVMVMYFLLALLEDCGYMARATVVLDPIFKKVGLSGKSVIPFVVGTGCAIPGVMACRTIRNERERRATAMLAPFMPCGAKLPVIALFAGAFFENAPWVGTAMYFAGIAIILMGAVLINRITGSKNRRSYFIIELPEYKLPSVKRALASMLERGWDYVVKAGTVILLCNTAVQVMQTFGWNLQEAENASDSILATIAQPISYVLLPIIGVASWQMAAAAVTGFIAKENVVGTLAVCFAGLQNLIDTEELEMLEGAGAEVAGMLAITKVAALAYLMFNLFTPPCFAALGAMKSEIGDKKWFWGGIALQFATGYTVSYLVYTVGTLLTDPARLDVTAAIFGLALVLSFVCIIGVLIHRGDKKEASVSVGVDL